MRYFLPLTLLALAPLPAGAISRQRTAECVSSAPSSQQIAQNRCYQVASHLPPDLLTCQQIGVDQLGRPIWICCPSF